MDGPWGRHAKWNKSDRKRQTLYTREDPPTKWNYLLKGGPLVVQASLARWDFQEPVCVSLLGDVVRATLLLTWLCLASVNFFEDSSNAFAHFMIGDLQMDVPILYQMFRSFWPKMTQLLCPTLPICPISPKQLNFVSPDEKCNQRESFANVEEVKQKMEESLKGIKIDKFKNCFDKSQ